METESSSPLSQQPATILYREPDKSNAPTDNISLRYILIFLSACIYISKLAFSFKVVWTKSYMNLSSCLSHSCHIPCATCFPWFNHPNSVCWRVQIMKFLIM